MRRSSNRCALFVLVLVCAVLPYEASSLHEEFRGSNAHLSPAPRQVPDLFASRPAPSDSLPLPVDSALQANLDAAIAAHPSWGTLAEENAFSLGIVDLADLRHPRYAAVNGEDMMYAASLPKIGILLAAVDALEAGTLSMTPPVRQDLDAMIRRSSNAAATRMINRLGGLDAVNDVLLDPKYHFYDEARGGGLWVGKRYSADGRRAPDPMEGLSHAATVYEVCRFYTLLAQHRLISEARSQQMLDLLDDPGLSHKFVGPLEKRAPEADIYRKSGTWRDWHADSALVWGPNRRYVAVALVHDERGAAIVRGVIPVVEQVLGISAGTGASSF